MGARHLDGLVQCARIARGGADGPVPSADWPRGLRHLAMHMQRHTAETGVRHWLSVVPPVDVRDHEHPYTSPARVFELNHGAPSVPHAH